MSRRYDESDYRRLAEQSDLEWVGGFLPDTVLDLTEWRCPRGHVFGMRAANVYMGHRCPHCSYRKRKAQVDYMTLAKRHGVEWVGDDLPRDVRQRTMWRMPDGKIVRLSYRVLASRNTLLAETGARSHGEPAGA